MALLGDLTVGKFVDADSPLHRLDPRTKFVGAAALMGGVLYSHTLPALAACTFFLAGLIRLSALPPGLVLRNLKAFVWLLFFTFSLHALFTPGQALWRLPYFDHAVTVEGLERGALFSARLSLVIAAAALMTLTTAPLQLTSGLERLLRPLGRLGLPSQDLAMVISIALRFIPVLIDEAERLQKAQLARGADPGGHLLNRLRHLVPLLVPLFVSAFGHADRLALAMESRCYRSGVARTAYHPLRLGRGDLYAATALAALLAFVFWRG